MLISEAKRVLKDVKLPHMHNDIVIGNIYHMRTDSLLGIYRALNFCAPKWQKAI